MDANRRLDANSSAKILSFSLLYLSSLVARLVVDQEGALVVNREDVLIGDQEGGLIVDQSCHFPFIITDNHSPLHQNR